MSWHEILIVAVIVLAVIWPRKGPEGGRRKLWKWGGRSFSKMDNQDFWVKEKEPPIGGSKVPTIGTGKISKPASRAVGNDFPDALPVSYPGGSVDLSALGGNGGPTEKMVSPPNKVETCTPLRRSRRVRLTHRYG